MRVLIDESTCPDCGAPFADGEDWDVSNEGDARIARVTCNADPSHRFEHVTLLRRVA